MRASYQTILKSVVENTWKDYTLESIDQGSEDNVFRGMVRKPTGSTKPEVQIILKENTQGLVIAHIINYAEGDDYILVNLDTGKVIKKDDEDARTEIDLQLLKKQKEEKLARFREKLPKSKSNKENPLLVNKKISLHGKAFNVKSKTWGHITNPICVPFYESLVAEASNLPCGAQIIGINTDGKSDKISITDSQFDSAFHILQHGKTDNLFKVRDGYICESYTTACEIAEACPDHFVACSAGITNQLKAANILKASDINIILVLDKVVAGKSPPKAEIKMKNSDLPFIQIDVTNEKYSEITDFNDFALKFGKRAIKKEIALQSQKFTTVTPEIVNRSEKGFSVISPITNTVELVYNKSLNAFIDYLCSKSTRHHFTKMHSLDLKNDNFHDRLFGILIDAVGRIKNSIPRGVGLFKEDDGFVLNFTNSDRYIHCNDEIKFTTKVRPFSKERYVNSLLKIDMKTGGNPDILSKEFTKNDFMKMFELWEMSYDMPRAYFLLLLGFLVQSAYVSFTEFSCHLWLLGTTGTGKSYFFKSIVSSLMNGLGFPAQSSTKAGVEQELAEQDVLNTPLVWLDEAGTDTEEKKRKITELIMVTREIFMGKMTPSFRGTKEQVAKAYYRVFCVALASVTDALRDEQDIARFILVNMKNFKLKGLEYDHVRDEFLKLNPVFLRGVFDGAQHFKRLSDLISVQFEDRFSKGREDISHKVASLISCLAGAAALVKVAYKWDDEKCVSFVFKHMEEAVEDQIAIHLDRTVNTDNFIDLLKRTYFVVGEMKGRLSGLCEDSDDSELHESFGIRLRKGRKDTAGYYNLLINKTKFRLNLLVSNPRQIVGTPVHDALTRLCELKGKSEDLSEAIHNGDRYFLIKRFCKIKKDDV